MSKSLRLTLSLILLLVAPTLAIPCTSNADGDYDAAGTWTSCGASIPGGTDDVTITHTVRVDTASAANTITLNAGGHLLITNDSTLTVSPTAGGDSVDINASASLVIHGGSILEIDNAATPVDIDIDVASGGRLAVIGSIDHVGVVDSIDLTTPTAIVLTEDEANWSANEHDGKTLVFTSGKARLWWYDITTTAATTQTYSNASNNNTETDTHFNGSATTLDQDPAAGDRYVIIDPAVITTASGDQADATANYEIYCNDGSFCDFDAARISYCGPDLGGGSVCIDASGGIDNESGTEHFSMRWTEVEESASSTAVQLLGLDTATIEYNFIHDAHANVASGDGHGISVCNSTALVVQYNHVARMNDDGILCDAGGTATTTQLTIRRNLIHDIPNEAGASAEGISLNGCLANCAIEDNFIYRTQDGGIVFTTNNAFGDDSDYATQRNIIVDGTGIGISASTSDDPRGITGYSAINNFIYRPGTIGIVEADTYYNTIIDFNSGDTASRTEGIKDSGKVFGNILYKTDSDNTTNTTGIGWLSSFTATTDCVVRDNIVVAAADELLIWQGVSGAFTCVIDNLTLDGRRHQAGANVLGRGLYFNDAEGTFTVTDSLVSYVKGTGIGNSNSAAATADYILYMDNSTDESAITATNTLVDETPVYGGSHFSPDIDYTPKEDGPQWEAATASDHIGARCAGADITVLWWADVAPVSQYPQVCIPALRRDSDGDHIKDHIDNCDFLKNPGQASGDC